MQLITLKALAKELSLQTYHYNVEFISQKRIENIFNVNYKYDCGKYKASVKNKEVSIDSDKPIWYVIRSDKDGPYLQLQTVQETRLSDSQLLTYDKIVDTWNKQND